MLTDLNSDDPFNHTAADNAEWLLRFKRSAGLLPADGEDGLPEYMTKGHLRRAKPWPEGHSPLRNSAPGAIPPSLSTQSMQIDTQHDLVFSPSVGRPMVIVQPGPPAIAPMTGTVFANSDFEARLVQFAVSEVASSGRMPPDAALQGRARELSGFEVWQAAPTPVDDPVLLAQFKALVVEKVKAVLGDDADVAAAPQRTAMPLLDHVPPPRERGLDAIDPGLLPALDSGPVLEAATDKSPAVVRVAISESRLEEIISEALQA